MASVGLAPVFALQGRYVRRVTPRLPEPPGPRTGVRGDGPALRLLIVGDSAAAGVGAASQDEALSGRLVDELAPTFRVSWMVVARTGATTGGTARYLARRPADECDAFDVAVLSLGGNDVMGRRPLRRWLEDMGDVTAFLRERFAVRHILISGLPPIHAFTALPQPLRWYLGARARRFDRALAAWARSQSDCEHLPLELTNGAGLLATDGLHPGPRLYERWSTELARRVRACWTSIQP
ncbi:MAG TPA: SGNH/GDSL hydrolase family protein [Gemmatimonadaceae bacterium]|nr:SGNH/GDSL hydrolase family protein [Gemmatimonadaceae bacterium]